MLYGRRLDEALEHVDGSRYALVHAVAKRARQITLWLTADPAELRAEAAPPPAAGELVTRDPVALAEAEILAGEVRVRWDPDGTADDLERVEPGVDPLEQDELLLETLPDDDDEADLGGDDDAGLTPALVQVLEGEPAAAEEDEEEDEDEPEEVVTAPVAEEEFPAADEEFTEVSMDDLAEEEEAASGDEDEL